MSSSTAAGSHRRHGREIESIELHVKVHIHNIMDIGDASQEFMADVSVHAVAFDQARALLANALALGRGKDMSLSALRQRARQRGERAHSVHLHSTSCSCSPEFWLVRRTRNARRAGQSARP